MANDYEAFLDGVLRHLGLEHLHKLLIGRKQLNQGAVILALRRFLRLLKPLMHFLNKLSQEFALQLGVEFVISQMNVDNFDRCHFEVF